MTPIEASRRSIELWGVIIDEDTFTVIDEDKGIWIAMASMPGMPGPGPRIFLVKDTQYLILDPRYKQKLGAWFNNG